MRPLFSPPGIRRTAGLVLAIVLAVSLSACSSTPAGTASKPSEPVKTSDVVLASTTSTQDSGLFDVLIPAFEKAKVVELNPVNQKFDPNRHQAVTQLE